MSCLLNNFTTGLTRPLSSTNAADLTRETIKSRQNVTIHMMFLRLSHVEREQWFLKYVISATTRLLTLATVPAAADPDKIIFRFPKFLSEFLAFP